MSYISTISYPPLSSAGAQQAGAQPTGAQPAYRTGRLFPSLLASANAALSSGLEATLLVGIMAGLSLVLCTIAAGAL